MSELFRSNSKTHFKMYKAGRKWLVAGISALSGLLGLGTIGSTSAKADTKTGAAKTLDTEDVAATKTTGTIPATSQATVQASTTDVSQSTSDQTSTQETSTTPSASATSEAGNQAAETTTNATGSATTGAQSAQNETTTDDQVTTTETTTDGTQPTTTQTTADQTATNSTAQKTDTTNENSTTGSTNEASESTDSAGSASESTAGSDALASDASASGSNDTTTITTDELKTMLATTNLTQENQNKVALMAASFSLTRAAALDLVNAFSTPKQYKDDTAYNMGITDATNDINSLISSMTVESTKITSAMVPIFGQGLTNYINSIKTGLGNLSQLFTDYENNQSLQESTTTAAPIWTGSSYRITDATSESFNYEKDNGKNFWGVTQTITVAGSTKDYNQGYSDYSRDFVTGIYQWLDGVKKQAANESTANSLLNNQTYNPSALSANATDGTTTGSALADFLKGIAGTKYAPDVLAFNNIANNIANSSISSATDSLNFYIGMVAPNLINGIAHQALSDVRSIGGTMADFGEDKDYVPNDLSTAVGLNATTKTLLNMFGIDDDMLNSKLFDLAYQAIAANAQSAIENSWAIGEDQALKGFLQNGYVYGDSGAATSPYSSINGYSETDPASILNATHTTNENGDSDKLSSLAEAAGYAWTQKIIGNVMTVANVDALGGQEKTNITEIVNQLVTNGKLSEDEANEILNRNSATGTTNEAEEGVAHVFDASHSALDYVRSGEGAQAVIKQLYDVEYSAAKAALNDYVKYPNMTTDQLAEN
ncbi:KxYKxGKxW signal peptide domain-containing protein [Levilactobacillus namurensis]|nr:KxYKxGKxW signal peptide domain-containing protein [Levilactobacillus namurensis]